MKGAFVTAAYRLAILARYNCAMKKEEDIHESFCSVYADAVVRFVVTGINEDVSFDAKRGLFVAQAVDDDAKPSDCEWWVGDDWPTFVGPISCSGDLADPKFAEETLKKAIVFALRKSATGKRMSQILAGLD